MENRLKALSIAMGLQFPEFYINFIGENQVVDSKLMNYIIKIREFVKLPGSWYFYNFGD